MCLSARLRSCVLLGLAAVCLVVYAPQVIGGGIQPAGVEVDATGVLRTKIFRDPTGVLTRKRYAAARAALKPDLARTSRLRKVSLTRLEAAIAERLSRGELETEEMKYLAGLTRITHVFYYPETQDVVIAGPAEGFVENISGRVVGIESGKATLQLQDLVTALRAFPPSGKRTDVISVSIDPTKEGLQRMQTALAGLGGRAVPRQTRFVVNLLKQSLGLQKVTIKGVSAKTHFAQVLVEADYRMKLIGIGLEDPAVDIVTYIQRAKPRDVARNALQRWFFVPNYDCVKVSEDDNAMELVGTSVKLVGQSEMVNADGSRVNAARFDSASDAFCKSFTRQFDKMAERAPVYGELRNLIDMAVVAAYIQHQDYYGKAGWTLDTLGVEDHFQVESYTAPQKVETAVNAKWRGRTLMTPIGGGVNIQPRQALRKDRRIADTDGKLQGTYKQIQLGKLKPGQWWWD